MTEPPDPRDSPESWLVTFGFDGTGAVRVEGLTRIDAVAPGMPGPIPAGRSFRGAWVELQDAAGTVLFERVLHDPFRTGGETPGPTGGRVRRLRATAAAGEFEVMLPALPDAAAVALWASPTGRGPAVERVRAELPPGPPP